VGNWYLCQTKSRDEHTAKINLERQGYEAYYPSMDGECLFPGYIFVSVDGNFAPIKSTRGVIKIVQFGEQLASIPESLVEQFRATQWQRSESCIPGAKIRITSGPFNYREAIVKAKKGDRIIVLLSMLNQEQEINLSMKDVEAA
jgi:transcriptional antiterminator RfaH